MLTDVSSVLLVVEEHGHGHGLIMGSHELGDGA